MSEFSKNDIKTGMIVEIANGEKHLTLLSTPQGSVFMSADGRYMSFDNFNNDLINIVDRAYDIVKVYTPTKVHYRATDGWNNQELVYTRPEPIIEVTLEEIAKMKGVNVSNIRIKK